jgi:hypothetical protein
MPFKPSDWDAYHPVTEHLAVARWGKLWKVVDKETGSQIGPGDWPTMAAAREYAEMRQATTYTPA